MTGGVSVEDKSSSLASMFGGYGLPFTGVKVNRKDSEKIL